MPRLRRFATLLFMPLAFQLVLAARAVECVNPTNVSASAAADTHDDMASMDMSRSANASRDEQSSRHGTTPCDSDRNPVNCQPLAPCASAVVPASATQRSAEAPISSRVLALVILTPPSWTTQPELPPPRA